MEKKKYLVHNTEVSYETGRKNWSFFRNWLAYILIFHAISIYIKIFFNLYVVGVLKLALWKLLLYLTMLNHPYFNRPIQTSLQSSHFSSFVPLSLASSIPFPVSSRIHFLFGLPKPLLLCGLFCFALLPHSIYCWAVTCLPCFSTSFAVSDSQISNHLPF